MTSKKLNESTQKAFESWLTIGGGINPNIADEERFYVFAYEYFRNKDNIDEKTFVKMCKKHTHTTCREKRGICQKYYRKLMTIIDFLKWNSKTKNF